MADLRHVISFFTCDIDNRLIINLSHSRTTLGRITDKSLNTPVWIFCLESNQSFDGFLGRLMCVKRFLFIPEHHELWVLVEDLRVGQTSR